MFNKIKSIFNKKIYRTIEKDEITIEQLKNMKEQKIVIIDVRSKQEYDEGHIDGAISVPEYEIRTKINKIVENENEIIIVYCSTGRRSKKAQKTLNKLGYINVFNLYNGYQNY